MRPRGIAHLFGAAASVFLSAFFVAPLLVIGARSFGDAGAVLRTLSDPYTWQRLGFTTGQALLSTALTMLVGLPVALLFARYSFPGKRAFTAAFAVPFVMPTVVAGIGFLALLGPRGLLGIDLRDTLLLVLLAHVFYNVGIVVRVVGSFLEGAVSRYRQAAQTLGAGPRSVLLRVTLPLATPALVAAATLVFVFCFTSFGVILFLAPSPVFATLEVEIYRLTARLLDLDGAAVLVVLQLLVVMAFTWLYTRAQANLQVALPGSRADLPRPRGAARVLLFASLLGTSVLVLAPLLALAVQALTSASGAFPSLGNLRAALEASPTIGYASFGVALRNSLLFAGSSTVLALLLGFGTAYAVVRGGWRVLDPLSLLPLAMSPITLAFGYLLTYPLLVSMPWGVPIAHALIAFPFVTRTLLPALRGLDPGVTAAAATLGAGPWRTLQRVELPMLGGSILAAASFAFAVSMGEFGATLLLVRPEYATLPVAIFDRLGRPGALNYGSALALSMVLMLLTALVMAALQRRPRGEF